MLRKEPFGVWGGAFQVLERVADTLHELEQVRERKGHSETELPVNCSTGHADEKDDCLQQNWCLSCLHASEFDLGHIKPGDTPRAGTGRFRFSMLSRNPSPVRFRTSWTAVRRPPCSMILIVFCICMYAYIHAYVYGPCTC